VRFSPREEPQAAFDDRHLSAQESRVLELASEGHTDKGIAHQLGISPATVVTYWQRIRAKFGLSARPELVAHYVREVALADVARLRAELEERIAEHERLAKTAAMLDEFFESAPEAMLLMRADGSIIRGNRRAADLLECEESDFPTLRGGRFIPPELHTIHRAHREKYIQNATRLTMGCGEGVDVLTFTGRRIKCVVTVDAARTADETVFVVILRAVESLRPDLQIAGISETG
jgi:DNA-binding CsgD family transcriptional regulator